MPDEFDGKDEKGEALKQLETETTARGSDSDEAYSHLPPSLDPQMVNRYFKVLFAAILIMSIDLGILPACSVNMQQELGIDNWKFGLLGSVVYLGQTLGAVMSSVMLEKVPPQIFLFVCIVSNILTLLYFTYTSDFTNLLLCRMLTGLFQIFFGVYQPVWADAFGNEA